MADQNVSIGFNAEISGFMAGVSAMKGAVGGMVAEMEKSAKARQALNGIGKSAGLVGLAAAAGFGVAVAAAANFDKAMSRTAAATHESASNMSALRKAALDAGQATQFSATEAADAITAMAKAGVSTADILGGGLTGALDLAAAGELDVAQAADIAATTLNQFGLAGSDVGHVADVLAAGAGKAQGEVSDFALSLKYVGPVAAQMGVSLEETTGAIAELAAQGILGSQAGTGLRGMLSSLTSPSTEASEAMKALGINMYDAQGAFIGFDGLAGQLHQALDGLTASQRDAALGTIFGNAQITAARILYKGGADDVRKWTNAVDDQGFAAETAALKMDNLAGDFEKLKGSLETALIGTGSGAQGPLRSLVQGLEDVTNAYNKLPTGVQGGLLGALGLTALTGGAIFALSRIATSITETRSSMKLLQAEAPKTAAALSTIGKVATFAALYESIGLVDSALDDLLNTEFDGSSLQRSLEALSGGTATGTIADVWGGDLSGLNRDLDTLDNNLARITDFPDKILPGDLTATEQANTNLQKLDEALAGMVESGEKAAAGRIFDVLADKAREGGNSVEQLSDHLEQYQIALDNAGGKDSIGKLFGDVGPNIQGLIGPLLGVGGAAGEAADKVSELDSAMQSLSGFLDRRAALRDYRESLATFNEAVKDSGGNFNRLTEKGRTAEASLDGVARSALKVAEGMKGANKTKFLQQTASDIAAVAKRMGILGNKDIQAVINKLREVGKIKAEPKTGLRGDKEVNSKLDAIMKHMGIVDRTTANPKIRADASQAIAAARAVINALAGIHDKWVTVYTNHVSTGTQGAGGHTADAGNAGGGMIRGPGTGTSDSITRRLSNGEFVTRAASVSRLERKYPGALAYMNRTGELPTWQGAAPSSPTVHVAPNVAATVYLSEQQFARLEAAVERGSGRGTARGIEGRERAARADRRVG